MNFFHKIVRLAITTNTTQFIVFIHDSSSDLPRMANRKIRRRRRRCLSEKYVAVATMGELPRKCIDEEEAEEGETFGEHLFFCTKQLPHSSGKECSGSTKGTDEKDARGKRARTLYSLILLLLLFLLLFFLLLLLKRTVDLHVRLRNTEVVYNFRVASNK